MSETDYLTPKELSERWKGRVSVRTLGQWRWLKKGPPWTKVGHKVLYSMKGVEAWEKKQSVK